MRHRFSRAFFVMTAAGAIALGGNSIAGAATQVGDLSQFGHLKPYCERVVYHDVASKWNVSASPGDAFNPYTWACRFFPISARGIDMNAACRYFYGSRAYAIATNKGWAWNSWKCFR